jgi:hypothetical protein
MRRLTGMFLRLVRDCLLLAALPVVTLVIFDHQRLSKAIRGGTALILLAAILCGLCLVGFFSEVAESAIAVRRRAKDDSEYDWQRVYEKAEEAFSMTRWLFVAASVLTCVAFIVSMTVDAFSK